jgi:hypothetical protein
MAYFNEPSGVEPFLSSYISSARHGIPEPNGNVAIQAHSFTRGRSPASVCRIEPGLQSISRKGTLPLEIVRPRGILGAP